MFQVKFDGWTVTLIEKVLPWETPAAPEVQSTFFAAFEIACQEARSRATSNNEQP